MASTIYVPGGAQVYTQTAASDAWEFMGWSERGVSPRLKPFHRDIPADYAGDAPADVLYTGQEASVSMSLVKYNEPVVMKCCHWLGSASAITAGQLLGTDPSGASGPIGIGTLMNLENASFGLAIQSSYAARSNNSAGGMIPGLYFYSAFLVNEVEIPHLMGARVIPMTFRCIPLFNSTTGVGQCFTTTLPGSLTVN